MLRRFRCVQIFILTLLRLRVGFIDQLIDYYYYLFFSSSPV